MKKYDYIVVGNGLMGSARWALFERMGQLSRHYWTR